MEDTFYIDFDTKDMPGKLLAVKVTISREILSGADKEKKLNVGLADHPLYGRLATYVKANPR